MKFFVIALLTLAVMVSQAPLSAQVRTGEPAPTALQFTTWDGASTSLESFKGKLIVLEWFNADCPFVKKHYRVGNMQALQKEYSAKDVVWLTVNSSAPGKQGALTAEAARETIKASSAAPTTVVLDPTGAFGKAFGAKTTPHMFVIDQSGKVVYQGAIDDNDSARSETIKDAKNFVRAALDEVLAGKSVSVGQTDSYGCSVKYAS